MVTILLIYFFLLGIIIGSFLNVVILRFNTGKTTRGRSACMSCKTTLTWRELIPVLSFLFQKGRCKTCKTRVSVQYPLVELVTGILFALNFWYWFTMADSMSELIIIIPLTTAILACLVVIFVYDLRHKIIPDLFSFTAWGLSIVYVVAQALVSVIPAKAGIQLYDSWILDLFSFMKIEVPLWHAFAGMTTAGTWVTTLFAVIPNILAGLFFYFIIWAIWKLSKGRMIGLGDAKLLLTIGTLLGFVLGLSAIFISVWIATVYAGYLLLKQYLNKKGKHITMKTEIPFGPFLIIGFLIVYFTQIDVTNIGMILEHIYEL